MIQASEVKPERSPLRLEIKKESLAEKLDGLADGLDRQGVALADRLRDLEVKGIAFASSGLRRTAEFLRRANLPDLILTEEKAELGRMAMPIALALGAGFMAGLILRKAVK